MLVLQRTVRLRNPLNAREPGMPIFSIGQTRCQAALSHDVSYEQGVLVKGIKNVWLSSADGTYFKFIQRSVDRLITDEGHIRTFKLDDYHPDNFNEGKFLLTLYKDPEEEKYKKANDRLREKLKTSRVR